MKRFLAGCLACLFLTIPAFASGQETSAAPEISAKYAALLVADTGELLYGKQEHDRASMASTTKIMTALLALEAGTPGREITVTDQMARIEGTSIGLRAGDRITLQTLVYGMLLESGNDAANCVALSLADSTQAFAAKMNERAAQIGMKDSHFVTPSGLDDAEHYSTAYDMALLGAEAIKNPEFAEICSTKQIRLSYGNPPAARTMTNHNRLLSSYDGAFGIKTGFTKKSGRCLVSAARRDGMTLVAVTLKAPNDWDDHKKLLDYGFSLLRGQEMDADVSSLTLPVVGGEASSIGLVSVAPPALYSAQPVQQISWVIELPRFVYAPVCAGDVMGRICYYGTDGALLREAPLCAAVGVAYAAAVPSPQKPERRGWLSRWFDRIRSLF